MLRELLPPGLEVDLVALEHAREGLRAHILGEKPISEEPLLALKELVEDELVALERIAMTVDGGLPGGAFSHANLLAQIAQELPSIRPATLNGALWLRLQDYLAFCHFFRHAYGYTLDWAKLRPLVMSLAEAHTDLQSQLRAVLAALLPES